MWARTPAEIGKIIRAARLRRKLSQAELARLLGTTQAWISEVEKGKDTAQVGLVLRTLTQLDIRLRADEPLGKLKPAKSRRAQHLDVDSIIERLSRPARNAGPGK
jgi:transcriptional regulator with XRE-family HTH domain